MRLLPAEIADKYNVNELEVIKALKVLDSKQAILFAMSGKMGSGKDTVGDKVSVEKSLSKYDIIQTSYATPLRMEVTNIVQEYNEGAPLSEMSEKYDISVEEITTLVKLLNGDSIYDRTADSRLAIQYWGTDVRRKQNNNYWVNKIVELIVDEVNKGKSIYVTDVRFPNEAYAILDLGGDVIRLDVSTDVRVNRIIKRDGLSPTNQQLTHKSEVGLDDFDFICKFDGTQTPDKLSKSISQYIIK